VDSAIFKYFLFGKNDIKYEFIDTILYKKYRIFRSK